MIAFALITPFLFFIRNMDLILIGFKPEFNLTWIFGNQRSSLPRCFFKIDSFSPSVLSRLPHQKMPIRPWSLLSKSQVTLFSRLKSIMSFLQMDSGPKLASYIELLSLSKIIHWPQKKITSKLVKPLKSSGTSTRALSPTVHKLSRFCFLRHARKWYLLDYNFKARPLAPW